MANEQNLIPYTSNQSREEAKKNGQKGGQKSGEVRRQKKTMKESMKMLLSLDLPESDGKEKLKQLKEIRGATKVQLSRVLVINKKMIERVMK